MNTYKVFLTKTYWFISKATSERDIYLNYRKQGYTPVVIEQVA